MLPLLALVGVASLSPPQPVPAAPLSLVVATSGRQWDPRPAPCGPDGSCGDFHYRSTFSASRNLAGAPLPPKFEARLKLHTPFISRYTLVLIVERLADNSLLVRRVAGFNGQTGVACFDDPGEQPVDWVPTGPGLSAKHGALCFEDKSQIDPSAPPLGG